jgi:nicotinate phosphoribosyltransferase
VKIVASNQLNEHVIKSLLKDQDAKIDAFGIGTELITGKKDAALDGVYKLASVNNKPKMKLSENVEKVTLPGKKQVCRFYDENGYFYRDAVIYETEKPEKVQFIYHPAYPEKFTDISKLKYEKLLGKVVDNGTVIHKKQIISEIHEYLLKRAKQLPDEHKRFISPHIYKVGISKELMDSRNKLKNELIKF